MWWTDPQRRWEVVSKCMDSTKPTESTGLAAMYMHGVGRDVMKHLAATPGIKPQNVLPALSHVDFSDLVVEFGKAVGVDEAAAYVVGWHWDAARGADDVAKRLTSHGVSVPVALARAGAVYGVAPEFDGQFIEIAKAATSEDVVTRAGLVFVSRWASGLGEKVTFAKNERDQFMREGEMVEVMRDSGGRFAEKSQQQEQKSVFQSEKQEAAESVFADAAAPITAEEAERRRRERVKNNRQALQTQRFKDFQRNKEMFDRLQEAKRLAQELEDEQNKFADKPWDEDTKVDTKMLERMKRLQQLNDYKLKVQPLDQFKVLAEARTLDIDAINKKTKEAGGKGQELSYDGEKYFDTNPSVDPAGHWSTDFADVAWEWRMYDLYPVVDKDFTVNTAQVIDVSLRELDHITRYRAPGQRDEGSIVDWRDAGSPEPIDSRRPADQNLVRMQIPLWVLYPAVKQTEDFDGQGGSYLDIGRMNALLRLANQDAINVHPVYPEDLDHAYGTNEYFNQYGPLVYDNVRREWAMNVYADVDQDSLPMLPVGGNKAKPNQDRVLAPTTILKDDYSLGYINSLFEAFKISAKITHQDWNMDDSHTALEELNRINKYVEEDYLQDKIIDDEQPINKQNHAVDIRGLFNSQIDQMFSAIGVGKTNTVTPTGTKMIHDNLQEMQQQLVEDWMLHVWPWQYFEASTYGLSASPDALTWTGESIPESPSSRRVGILDVIEAAERGFNPFSGYEHFGKTNLSKQESEDVRDELLSGVYSLYSFENDAGEPNEQIGYVYPSAPMFFKDRLDMHGYQGAKNGQLATIHEDHVNEFYKYNDRDERWVHLGHETEYSKEKGAPIRAALAAMINKLWQDMWDTHGPQGQAGYQEWRSSISAAHKYENQRTVRQFQRTLQDMMMDEQFRGEMSESKDAREAQQRLIVNTLARDLAGIYMADTHPEFLDDVDSRREQDIENVARDMADELDEEYATRRPDVLEENEVDPGDYNEWLGVVSSQFTLDEMGGNLITVPELQARLFPNGLNDVVQSDQLAPYHYEVENLADIVGTIESVMRRVVSRDEAAGDIGQVVQVGGTVGETRLPYAL